MDVKQWRAVPVEATNEMTSAVRAGTLEPQSMTHQMRIVERIKNDYTKLLAAAPTDAPALIDPETHDAMMAHVRQLEELCGKQAAELTALRQRLAEAERDVQALRHFNEGVARLENCSDRHCVIRPNAVGTNGGCKCWDDRHKARLMFAYVKRLRDSTEKKS